MANKNETNITMKKLINFLVLSIFISCTTDKIEYFDTDFQKVFKLAAKHDKLILIDFYTVWCGPCQNFNKNMKHDSIFKSYITEKFYTLQIDAELEQNKEIVSIYKPTGYPTFVITNPQGKEIDRIGGFNEKMPETFISIIENALKGNHDLVLLKNQFIEKPDSIELFQKIVFERLFAKQMYNDAIELSDFTINHSNNSVLIDMARFVKALAFMEDSKISSPKLMTAFVQQTNDEQMKEYGYSELKNYYYHKNIIDSVKYYYDKLILFESGNYLDYVRKYAEFLYKNNINIEYANKLTKEYSECPGNNTDHWTPYLNGHSLAKQGKLKIGIENFDNWMTKYSKPENFDDDYWHYKFYIDFILFYHVASFKALEYAKKFESKNPNIDNKKQLAELYYLNGKIKNAVDKIKEIQAMIEDPKINTEYDDLIKKYTDKQ